MSPISNASRLADFGSGIGTAGAIIQVDNLNQRVGIGTTNPQSMLQVGTAISMFGSTGIVSATTFYGDGSNLTGVANTDYVVSVATTTGNLNVSAAATITGDLTVSDSIAVTKDINIGAAATITGALSGSTGTFSGAVNVDATTDSTSSTTGALIVDGGVGIAKNVYIGAGLSVAGTLTYEDVTNVDSVGLITAKSGVNISGGQLQVGVAYSVGAAGVVTAKGATFNGDVEFNGNAAGVTSAYWDASADSLIFKDNSYAKFGDGSDLSIYHGGGNSSILNSTGVLTVKNTGSGKLQLMTQGAQDVEIKTNNELSIKCNNDGAVEVYYDASKKFETTNDGTVTTGVSTATGGLRINADGSASASHLALGASLDDLVMWHQNGNSYLVNNDGNLTLRSDGHVYIQDASGNTLADFNEDGPVELYHNANKKFETTNDGTVTTGIATASNVVASGQLGIGGAPADYQQLHITATDPRIRIESSGTNAAKIQFADSGSPDVGAIEYAHSDDSMRFNTASGERARITSAGNLGIGIVNPSEKLTVSSGNLAFIGGTNDAQYIKFGDSGDDDIGNIFYYHGNNNMVFTTNTSEKLRITSDGALGLNGTNYGTSGQVLTSGGSGSAPSWADAGGGATEVIQSWDFGANYGQSYFETSATGITTSSGFISYELIISGLQFVGGEAEKLAVRVYKSGGSLETGSNYKTYCRKSQFLSTSDENETANSVSTWELMGTNNQDREFWDGSIKWKNPGYTTGKTMPPFMRAEWYQQARFAHFDICQVNFGNTDYISGIRVYNNSDASVNLMSGRACLIGYKFV